MFEMQHIRSRGVHIQSEVEFLHSSRVDSRLPEERESTGMELFPFQRSSGVSVVET